MQYNQLLADCITTLAPALGVCATLQHVDLRGNTCHLSRGLVETPEAFHLGASATPGGVRATDEVHASRRTGLCVQRDMGNSSVGLQRGAAAMRALAELRRARPELELAMEGQPVRQPASFGNGREDGRPCWSAPCARTTALAGRAQEWPGPSFEAPHARPSPPGAQQGRPAVMSPAHNVAAGSGGP